jgi:hypothetical protein
MIWQLLLLWALNTPHHNNARLCADLDQHGGTNFWNCEVPR